MRDFDTGIYMDLERLSNFAKNTASAAQREGYVSGAGAASRGATALTRLKARLTPMGSAGELSQAAQWFSDNWYIAEREGRQAVNALRRAKRLPNLAGTKRPAVLEAAAALIRSGRGEVTAERIRLFLDEYQTVSVLTERELALFVPALKLELCIFLDGVCPESFAASKPGEDGELAGLLRSVFTSLRLLGIIDVTDILEDVNRVESTLRQDPAGVYPLMDEDTRRDYRRTLAVEARRQKTTEIAAAQLTVKLAREAAERGDAAGSHVGAYIYTTPLGKERRERTGALYVSIIVLTTLFFTVLSGMLSGSLLPPVLLLLPISEIVKNALDCLALKLVRPRRMPRLELEHGVPKSAKTVCVISALLTSREDGARYARLLEEYRLANRDAGENLIFGVLADLREADAARTGDDGPILDAAVSAVEALNAKYNGGFCLLYRERELNSADNIWMGRERKRGAMEELTRLISGENSALRALAGDGEALRGAAFILTLDADTRLTAGSARELIGAALHPLNAPRIDQRLGRVVSGYGILEPRVAVDLKSAGKSDFSRIFAGQGGVDPYNSVTSDLYQDLFGEGTFMGKGLINVSAYRKLLEGRFPDNTVLSHDILEGAYLRCGYVTDIELTDGCPYKVTGWLARQERWTRGDWQNLRWCLGRVKDRSGALVRNTLTPISRWKLADNLRRSLVPASELASFLAAFLLGGRAAMWTAVIALCSGLSGLILSSAELILRHDGSSRARYQSAIIAGAAGVVMRELISLMLLPATAFTQLKAAVTALYRLTVSKRKLLNWVTSSDAERRHGNTVLVNYRQLLACPVTGAAVILLTPRPWAAAVGLIWLFAPAYAWALSRVRRNERTVSGADRAFLMSCAGDIWKYFEENLTERDGYLPPDNVQEEPDLGPARRTSPTNIGLAMLSCAAAADLGLIDTARAAHLVKGTLASCIRLEKWNGHLLNWYDTSTLLPMEPRYVSTVDSGNLAGALIALRQWFLAQNDVQAAQVCEKLVEEMDFTCLYDSRRRLFHIGYDLTKSALTEGWYDLLASEARQTSYLSVALGQAPKKHWRRLGRALVSLDSYSGMASWTGTMFEYLMPNLLLPCFPDSLIYESSRFCLYAQRRAQGGMPWGISESGYYAFDPGLSYRYKAHGVQRLALKRGMGSERVVSPYSSFLALPLDTKAAVRNLRKLRALGMTGRYGFYEAADFTPSRAPAGKCQIVRSFMVHHLGMSLVAVANTLCSDIFPRRFMSDERMAAFSELLEERVPLGQIVLRQPPRDVPAKPARQEEGGLDLRLGEIDAISPRCVPLSNGQYTVLCAESGQTRSTWHGLDVTRFRAEALGAPGIAVYLRTPEWTMPLTAAPDFDPETSYSAEFTASSAVYRAKRGGVTASLTVTVPPSGAGEERRVEVTAPADTSGVELICVFEPVLMPSRDFEAHPAFARLGLEAKLSRGVLTVRRRPREPGERSAVLALASTGEMTAVTHTRRGGALGSGELLRASPDIRVTASTPVELRLGRGEAAFALAAAYDEKEASSQAQGMLKKRETQSVSRIGAAALMLGMHMSDVRSALIKLPGLVYGPAGDDLKNGLLTGGGFKREDLWRFGVSGDLPVMAARIGCPGELEAAKSLVREHAFLTENGVQSDLVLIVTDGGDYRSAQREGILDLLRRLGRESSVGNPGGVHIVDGSDPQSAAAEALSHVLVRLDGVSAAPEHRGRLPMGPVRYISDGSAPALGLEDGVFRFRMRGSLPEAAWSHILTNDTFGYLATECGAGYMWYQNSRLMRLTPPPTDAMSVSGGEGLWLIRGGERRSLFAAPDGLDTAVEYGMGYAVWERDLGEGVRSRLTAFVPREIPARLMIVELTGDLAGAQIEYSARLTLGESTDPGPNVETSFTGGAFTAVNRSGDFRDIPFIVLTDVDPACWTCSRDSYLLGDFDGAAGRLPRQVAAFRAAASQRIVLAAGCCEAGELRRALDSADALLASTRDYWRDITGSITVETPDERINNYVNRWAVYQTLACRLTARTALYQNGGATGFRDQLQDAAAMLPVDPGLLRDQIIQAAGSQYSEGDVRHWWHRTPADETGVRTRCSDDLLWLPWAVCEYVEATGDLSVLSERAPFLESPPLREEERDRYERASLSDEDGSVLDHALRAADLFLSRGTGTHGLALMLGGDWNDGFDGVGRRGRGESVWLTLFGSMVLRRLSELTERQGLSDESRRYSAASSELMRAAERAWSGEWYLRGWYDDGAPLGGPGGGECELDSISQSFAVFAGADRAKSRSAVDAAYRRLADAEGRVVKLFDPPFDAGDKDPGYIRSYAPGFRENGGQYTHGAIWLAMALLRLNERDRGASLLAALSPWGRDKKRYAAEPYVLAGDVYTAQGIYGRGGWSWYTGSAGWYLRAVTEELLGLKMRDGRLYVEPRLPDGWQHMGARIEGESGPINIDIYPEGILVNGEEYKKDGYPLKIHKITVSKSKIM